MFRKSVEQLEKELEEIEPTEPDGDAYESPVDWKHFNGLPAAKVTSDHVGQVCNMLDYPLSGSDPAGINKLIKGGYFKAALEKLEKWEMEAEK